LYRSKRQTPTETENVAPQQSAAECPAYSEITDHYNLQMSDMCRPTRPNIEPYQSLDKTSMNTKFM